MAMRFEAEEIDGLSLEYLRRVHETRGEGMPGVYLDAKTANLTAADLPGCGAIIGLVLVPVTLFIAWLVILHDPINVAMLLTAGLFLGLWLIVAWIRTKIEQNRTDYIGHFKYVDGLYLWQGGGRGVWVTPLTGLRDAEITHTHGDQGEYKNSTVHVRLDAGSEDVVVQSEDAALRLRAFLRTLPDMRGSPVERGYAALDAIDDRYDPSGYPAPRDRVVDAIPEPHRARRAFGAWKYLVVLALFALTYFLCFKVCTVLRDNALGDIVLNRANHPIAVNDRVLMLRAYLIDKRNTRHRDEVERALARYHEEAAARILALNGTDPKLKKVLADIVRSLNRDPQPVISVAVRGEAGATPPPDLVTKLGTKLSQVVGDHIAAVGDVRESPAHVEVRYRNPLGGHPAWAVTIGVAPGAKDHQWEPRHVVADSDGFMRQFSEALTGQP